MFMENCSCYASLQKGDKSDAGNYRPVSLISCVGKSFERVIFKHVYNHIADNNLLYKYQSGFLPEHSTIHHLIEIIHHTCLALENYETKLRSLILKLGFSLLFLL